MADRAFRVDEVERRFEQWPALMRLAVGFLAGLLAVLWDQAVAFISTPWSCSVDARWGLHLEHAVFLAIALAVAFLSWQDWVAVGRGLRDDEATVAGRTRFLALVGMAASVYSAIVIIAMWIAVLFIGPCRLI